MRDGEGFMFLPRQHGMLKVFLLALVCSFLNGCYGTDYEVLSSGDKIPMSGKFVCRGIRGDIQHMEFQETSSGFFKPSYEYYDPKAGSNARFKHLQNNFFLVQQPLKGEGQLKFGAKYVFSYYHFNAPGKVSIYVPDIRSLSNIGGKKSTESRAILSSARRNGIDIKMVRMAAKLHGTLKNTEVFLSQHIAEMLTKISDCIHE